MDLATLRAFDGSNEEGRICMAVDGTIFDVSPAKRLYGKGGLKGWKGGRGRRRREAGCRRAVRTVRGARREQGAGDV